MAVHEQKMKAFFAESVFVKLKRIGSLLTDSIYKVK